jgi:signal transduction histidine kinase
MKRPRARHGSGRAARPAEPRSATRSAARDGRAEARAQQMRFEAALENMSQGLCFFDGAQKLIVANRRYAELYDIAPHLIRPGMSLREIIDLRFAAGSCPKMSEEEYHAWRNKVAVARERSESIVEMQNGRTIIIKHQPMPDGGWVATHEDVTERRRQEEELRCSKTAAEQANQAKSRFLANMSHELRTPLNAVLGFSEIIATEALGPNSNPNYADYARDIHSAGTHLLAIINDILDLARVEAGRLQFRAEPIDTSELIDEVFRMVAGHAARAKVEIRLELPLDLPPIHADPGRLRQVLLNLLNNAIKFTPAGGLVCLDVRRAAAADRLILEVRDSGIGIDERDIPVALAPFGQVDSALARRHEGTGLGLPLSKSLVEAMGGTFHLASGLGKGTRIEISLPLSDGADNPGV